MYFKTTNKYIFFSIIILLILLLLICLIYSYGNKINNNEYFNNDLTNVNEMMNNSVVIVGCARNIEAYLDKTISIIEMIQSCFTDSRVVIYENDSNDKTLDKLQSWSNAYGNNKIEIITEKNVSGLRTQRLSHGRNLVMKKALEYNTDFIIVMDLDIVNHELIKDIFLSSIKNFPIPDWAGLFANQSEKYYDLWALRTKDDWMPFDFKDCLQDKSNDWDFCLHSRYKKIPHTNKPIEVLSAFGGIGIYKTKYIQNAEYYGGKDNKEECEHVKFNKDIIKNGGKLYINTELINSSGLSN